MANETPDIANFWRAGPGLRETRVALNQAVSPGVTLARLGTLPGAPNPDRAMAWLHSCYETVQRGAKALAAGDTIKESVKAAQGPGARRKRRR